MIGNYIFFSFDIVITKESLQGSKKKKEKEKKKEQLASGHNKQFHNF